MSKHVNHLPDYFKKERCCLGDAGIRLCTDLVSEEAWKGTRRSSKTWGFPSITIKWTKIPEFFVDHGLRKYHWKQPYNSAASGKLLKPIEDRFA